MSDDDLTKGRNIKHTCVNVTHFLINFVVFHGIGVVYLGLIVLHNVPGYLRVSVKKKHANTNKVRYYGI
jgi:hypothetical protein